MNTFYAQHSATARLFAVFTMFALLLSAFSAPLSAFAQDLPAEEPVASDEGENEEAGKKKTEEEKDKGPKDKEPKDEVNPQVTLCHATKSGSNPYNSITTDAKSIVNLPNGHNEHDDGGLDDLGDIIPSFDYNFGEGDATYSGKNLNTVYGNGMTGAEILANDCAIPTDPVPVTCELVVKSDVADLVVEKNAYAQVLTTVHPGWVQFIPSSVANWIWGDDPVAAPTTEDETQTFKKSFVWNGLAVDSAVLTIASDNSHAITLGTFSGGDAGEFNYNPTKDYDVTLAIVNGLNLLTVEVKNFGVDNTGPADNPAGLIYELKITGRGTTTDCGVVVPLEPEPVEPEDPVDPEDPAPVCEVGVNLLTNGSFETPGIPEDGFGWDIYDSVVNGLAWVVNWLNPTDSSPVPAKLELQGGYHAASHGVQYAELDSNWNAAPGGPYNGEDTRVSIYQDIVTIPGNTYTVAYAFSALPGYGADTNILQVLLDDVEVAEHSADGVGQTGTVWTSYSYTFVATSSVSRIGFADAGAADSFGTLLDNVSVECTPVTPEEEVEPTPTRSGGNGSGGRLGRSSGTPTVAGDSISTPSPEPMVLGEQVTAVPYGAPGTGNGGSTHQNTLSLGNLLFLAVRRTNVK